MRLNILTAGSNVIDCSVTWKVVCEKTAATIVQTLVSSSGVELDMVYGKQI
ncbi:MAG: hypothetical protein GXO90_11440 [FCB group bacterium]|nr:hypothetical protein [FCB group bacterium]